MLKYISAKATSKPQGGSSSEASTYQSEGDKRSTKKTVTANLGDYNFKSKALQDLYSDRLKKRE